MHARAFRSFADRGNNNNIVQNFDCYEYGRAAARFEPNKNVIFTFLGEVLTISE